MAEQITAALYVVATPIGNLGDITYRAVRILGGVDFIAAEDTRVTAKLLNALEIKKPLTAYHAHNLVCGSAILDRIQQGESCALCTDAGTPAVSDPGEILVREARQRGIKVVAVPGACAAVTALSVSGLSTGKFCFEGFLSTSAKSRSEHLLSLKNERRTMIFYEAPHKLLRTLKDMHTALGDRNISIHHELTKIYESCDYTTLDEAVKLYTQTKPKGEYVLVIEGAGETQAVDFDTALQQVLRLEQQGMALSQAAKEVSGATGISKNKLYNGALEKR